MSDVKPLFKFIGGKTFLRDKLCEVIDANLTASPKKIYIEPFCGGLGSFLAVYKVLLKHGVEEIVLNDINTSLIACYNAIAYNTDKFKEVYLAIEAEFNASKDKKAFFLDKRKQFNVIKNSYKLESGAILAFLQKHSFNGIYRCNSKGGYNTPFNQSEKAVDLAEMSERIDKIHGVFAKFKEVHIVNGVYEEFINDKNAFYYLDPPYLNEAGKIENHYDAEHFGLEEQLNLICNIQDLSFVYSNHWDEHLVSYMKNNVPSASIMEVGRRNIITAQASARGELRREMLVSKY